MKAQNDAHQIQGLANQLDAAAKQIAQRIEDLEAAGIQEGTYYFRDGKYMYVNYSEHGVRVRAYIGADPEKQKRVKADIERYRERATLLRQLDELHEQRQRLDYDLRWLRSRFQDLAKKMVTPGSSAGSAGVTKAQQLDLINDARAQMRNLAARYRW